MVTPDPKEQEFLDWLERQDLEALLVLFYTLRDLIWEREC